MSMNPTQDGNSSQENNDIVYQLISSPNFEMDFTIFAAQKSGLRRSDDAGQSWFDALSSLNLVNELPILAACLSPHFPADPTIFAGAPGGVLRSADNGVSWEVAMFPEPVPVISSMVISPNFLHDGIVFAGTLEDGVFTTNDRGGRWAAWNFGLLDLNVLCLVISPNFENDETLFAGVESGIFRSTNGGRAWRETLFPLDKAPILSLQISPTFSDDGKLIAGTESDGLFISYDWGMNWKQIDGIPKEEPINAITGSASGIVAVSNSQIYISRDAGNTWNVLRSSTEQSNHAISSCIAPEGIEMERSLVVGLANGNIIRAKIIDK